MFSQRDSLFPLLPLLRRTAAGLALCALASCGGGSYQVQPFIPDRVLSFGDETSLLVAPEGRKYAINGLSSTNAIDCTVNPLWIQALATSYDMVYPECNPGGVAQPTAHTYATLNAKVDDLATQIAAFQANDGFNARDMITLYVGVHDVIDVYTAGLGSDETSLLAEMRTRGAALAAQVNALTRTGAKVLLLTIPDLGDSPFAFNATSRTDIDPAVLLSEMSDAFNRSMRSNIVNDGSKIGLVLVDDFVHGAVRLPANYGLKDATDAACPRSAALPNCTTNTIATDPNTQASVATDYLWADAIHLGSVAHVQMGQQLVSRAHTNPF